MMTGQDENKDKKRTWEGRGKIQMRNRTAGGQDWNRTGTGQMPEQEEDQDRMMKKLRMSEGEPKTE